MRNDIQFWLENWQAMHGGPEVSLYDFGGSTSVPIIKDGNYLTTQTCYLQVRGDGKPNLDTPARTGVTYMGGGWFFHGVDIPLGTTRDELFAALDAAKEKLLAGVKEHGEKAEQADKSNEAKA